LDGILNEGIKKEEDLVEGIPSKIQTEEEERKREVPF
jgi:hypothetical protein